MKFEMFASKKLVSEYIQNYLSKVNEIENQRAAGKKIIDYIPHKFDYLTTIINVHGEMSNCANVEELMYMEREEVVKRLNEALHSTPYSEEELNYIFFNKDYYDSNPYFEIAMRRLLFSIYETQDVEEILKVFEKEKEFFTRNPYAPFIQVLKQEFPKKEEVIKRLMERFEMSINREFNCGGYAFEIYEWVSCYNKDHDVMVTKILLNPSVRLLGESLLQEDEYLVVLDATNYHFIKNKDGKFFEKNGPHPIGDFEGWSKYSKSKERDLIYFAVKKEHDMNFRYVDLWDRKILTYDELVFQAIQEMNNTGKPNGGQKFEYHNNTYTVQKNEDGGYDVISNGEKVADVLIEEEEQVVVIDERKREYIRNTRAPYYESLYKAELEMIRTMDYPKIPGEDR